MRTALFIGLGSFIGGVLRYLISQAIHNKLNNGFPYGTLTVNIAGCFLIGVLFGLADRSGLSNEWKLFLATGVLGGFTTFSAFSYESIAMIRDGQLGSALIYIFCSILIGLLATWGGIALSQ